MSGEWFPPSHRKAAARAAKARGLKLWRVDWTHSTTFYVGAELPLTVRRDIESGRCRARKVAR